MQQLLPIVYLHTHDSGRIFSPYGYQTPSPNIQKLAEDALTFRQAFCASPTCSPSRSALLTGQYPHSCGMLGLSNRGFTLKDPSHHLVTTLKRQGYTTALCGIQHEVGTYYDHVQGAQALGYDENLTTGQDLKSYANRFDWDRENACKAAEWIANQRPGQPFFLSYGQFATHRPYSSTQGTESAANYVKPPLPIVDNPLTRADYTGHLDSIDHADQNIGIILNALKKAGLYEHCLIIFTTDHGIAFPGAKCTLTDAGTGVALIMRLPGSKANGRVCDQLVSQVDVYPTLCEILGIQKPEWLEGTSFKPYLDGDLTHNIRSAVFTEITYHASYEPVRAVRTNRYKYVKYYDNDFLKTNLSNIDDSPTKHFMVENGLENQAKSAEALYDLYYDPLEKQNLIHEESVAKIILEMQKYLRQWQVQTNDPLLQGKIKKLPEWKVNLKESRSAVSLNPDDYEP